MAHSPEKSTRQPCSGRNVGGRSSSDGAGSGTSGTPAAMPGTGGSGSTDSGACDATGGVGAISVSTCSGGEATGASTASATMTATARTTSSQRGPSRLRTHSIPLLSRTTRRPTNGAVPVTRTSNNRPGAPSGARREPPSRATMSRKSLWLGQSAGTSYVGGLAARPGPRREPRGSPPSAPEGRTGTSTPSHDLWPRGAIPSAGLGRGGHGELLPMNARQESV